MNVAQLSFFSFSFTPANISGYIGSQLYCSSHAFFSACLHLWHLVRCVLTFSDVTNFADNCVFWIKNPIDVLSVKHVLQEITYKTVTRGCRRREWTLAYMRLRPYLFPNHLESPDKEHLGIPYYEYTGCLSQSNELPAIFSMHERFSLILPFNSPLMITLCL